MVNLALLWHMHQPFYEDLATGEHILPWVRLHAIKDYWGMVALLEEFPGVRVTFNLVPSLVVQVQAFAEDRARDRHLAVGLKPALDLTEDEARWLVANGFHAPYGRMIGPYPRYAELHAARMAGRSFTADELRDLQVWHKLVWIDPDWLARDARLQQLVAKDRGFTEVDKVVLRGIELELLRLVVPAYRAASERGQVELSCSPFYHPILPLLYDSDTSLQTHAEAARPRTRFARPDDATLQIERALTFHEQTFGRRPVGMWPSEGAVSNEAVALMARAGMAGWPPTRTSWRGLLVSACPATSSVTPSRPSCCIGRIRSDLAGRSSCFATTHCPIASGFTTRRGTPAPPRTTSLSASGKPAGASLRPPAGKWRRSASSSMVRMPGNTTPTAGGRFLRALYGALRDAGDIRP